MSTIRHPNYISIQLGIHICNAVQIYKMKIFIANYNKIEVKYKYVCFKYKCVVYLMIIINRITKIKTSYFLCVSVNT